MIERWTIHPTPIRLTVERRTAFDTLRAQFIKESERIKAQSESKDAAVAATLDLYAKSKVAVRALLTPKQAAVFDKNVALTASSRKP